MKVTVHNNSGFCFGVVEAIKTAEQKLDNGEELYCLGDIVHNEAEINRLSDAGLKIINHNDLKNLSGKKVLVRAHGEPPSTYQDIEKNNVTLVDATCPIVLKLQQKIKKASEEFSSLEGQIVIYGKKGHPEVVGLNGQIGNKAIVITSEKDLDLIDFNKPVRLYSQTTMSAEIFEILAEKIFSKMQQVSKNPDFEKNNTVCGQMKRRTPDLRLFAVQYDIILFVSGKKSSNGRYLYGIVKEQNDNTFFISNKDEIQKQWFVNVDSVGICGATSTPQWLMDEVADSVRKM
ncbi:MAG: 4-hydroxy-3-methylbut-2-enyl diphosphate reductase [Bacteroidota bacterium]|nr:4-hydroxy-3-methylbut-2-enyl diphosphate reductase [Bacteroidota bacterium]